MATTEQLGTDDTEEAINRVLGAERDARAAIERCVQQAAATVDAARQRARHLAAHTDVRIGKVHARCSLALGRQIEALLRQEQAGDVAPPAAHDDEVLVAAVEHLAAALTGDDGTA